MFGRSSFNLIHALITDHLKHRHLSLTFGSEGDTNSQLLNRSIRRDVNAMEPVGALDGMEPGTDLVGTGTWQLGRHRENYACLTVSKDRLEELDKNYR